MLGKEKKYRLNVVWLEMASIENVAVERHVRKAESCMIPKQSIPYQRHNVHL